MNTDHLEKITRHLTKLAEHHNELERLQKAALSGDAPVHLRKMAEPLEQAQLRQGAIAREVKKLAESEPSFSIDASAAKVAGSTLRKIVGQLGALEDPHRDDFAKMVASDIRNGRGKRISDPSFRG